MKRLLILRHAQALSTEPGGTDKSRKLSPKGKADARALGGVMLKQDLRPDLVLCSPATRTRETLECVSEGLGALKSEFPDAFYNASPAVYLQGVHGVADEAAQSLLIVGHNPGVHALAGSLVNEETPTLLNRLSSSYAPATLSIIECDVERWGDIEPYENRLMGILEASEYNGPQRPTRWM